MSKRSHGKTIFQISWLDDKRFKSWLKRGQNPSEAVCMLCCNSKINIEKMGISALLSHAKGKKHIEREKTTSPLSSIFFQTKSTVSLESASTSNSSSIDQNRKLSENSLDIKSSNSNRLIENMVVPVSVSLAEIRWVLKVVSSSFSLRSCLNLNELFKKMFADSTIAQSFQLSKTKCGYYINYGIAPFLKSKIENAIKMSPFFTLMFDESLNSYLQNEQMDLQMRFWSEELCKVETKYFESKFLNRANSETICEALVETLKTFDESKMLMLAMDGPSTNWAVVDKLTSHREQNDMKSLMDVGSCGLHVIHGAFQVGVESTNWELNKIFQAMWKILHDSCARRDIYKTVNRTDLFPLPFCKTRWVEDEKVAVRGIEVWPCIVEFIKYFQSLTQSKRPKNNKSYDTLVRNYNDKLMLSKMQFFHDIARILREFLLYFQTDNPMMPFMSDVLEKILLRIMKMFVLKEVLKEASTVYKLIKIDINDQNILLPPSSLKLPTATEGSLKSEKITMSEKLQFKKDCTKFLQSMVRKLQERSPLKYLIVRCMSCLSPENIVNKKEACVLKFEKLVDKLYNHKYLTAKESDDAKIQYTEFLDSIAKINVVEFSNFESSVTRLDTFYGKWLHKNKNFKSLWKVMICIFTLSHGQSQIERGFSINSGLMVENMHEKSVCSQRLVADFIKSSEKEIHEIEIEKGMLLSCKSAYSKYKVDLEEKALTSKKDEKSRKREMIIDQNVKRKKLEIESCIESLTKDVDKYYDDAERENNMTLLVKANAIRKSITEKKELVNSLDAAIEKLNKDKSLL